jgi:anti-sigma factor RsiW
VTCLDAVRLVDAFVDEELNGPEAAAFRTHIDGCRACGRAVDGRLALRRVVRRLPYASAPDRLRAAIETNARSARRPKRFALAAAAVLVLAAGTLTAVRVSHLRSATNAIVSGLVADHVRALQTAQVVDVHSTDQHTVKPWFLGKIDYAPPVDDPASAGFPLAGGRLARIGGRTVAVLVYQRRLHPIDVFVWPEGDTAARTDAGQVVRGFNVRHWTANGMSYWAVTDANAADLEALARLLR